MKRATVLQFYQMNLKLIEEIEMTKGAKIKPVKDEKDEDDLELQSVWPQLSKVLKWLVENDDEEAAELLELIIQRRKQEIPKELQKLTSQMLYEAQS